MGQVRWSGGNGPYIVQMHNFPAEAGEDAAAKEEFGYAIQHLPEGEKSIFVSWVGQELHAAEKAMLEDLNRGDPRSKEYGPYAAEVLVGIVRAVAARNEFVGRGLLINALPKWAIHPGSTETLLLAGGPMWENLSFMHLPSDDDDPVVRGPHYVCEDRQMSNFQAWVPSEDEIQKMQEGAPPAPLQLKCRGTPRAALSAMPSKRSRRPRSLCQNVAGPRVERFGESKIAWKVSQ